MRPGPRRGAFYHEPMHSRLTRPAQREFRRTLLTPVALGAATLMVLSPAGAPAALAQQAQEPAPESAAESAAESDAHGTESDAPVTDALGNLVPSPRDKAPDTDSCPHSLVPAEPRSTSERLAPGEESPTPPPPAEGADCGITAARGYEVPEEQTAAAWIVFDIDSGDVIAQKDPHGRYRPASIIKVLLALTAIDELDLDAEVPVSEKAATMEGSSAGIGTTGTYTARDLLYGLLLNSGNDAAQALAEALGGEEATLEKVNALAERLGAHDTHVADYTGLDKPGQMTSAHDLALMYRAAWENPTFAEMVDTDYVNFPGHHDNDPDAAEASTEPAQPAQPGATDPARGNDAAQSGAPDEDPFTDDDPSNGYQLWNDNQLFLQDPDGIGGKTGYTDDAHHTFVGALDRDGRRLAAVVLDTTIDKGRAWEQTQRFLHAAYEVPAGEKVDSLAETTGEVGAGATTAPEADDATGGRTAQAGMWAGRGTWVGAGVVAAVVLAAGLGVWLTRRRR